MAGQRLRVLIVAHELSPYSGSECAVGWNIVTRLANYHDVTVLYSSGSQFKHSSYVKSINKYFQTSPPIYGLTLINIDLPAFTKAIAFVNSAFKRLSPIGLPLLYYTGYKLWQKSVFKKAKQLHQRNYFEIVHQLTQISFREPGYLWKLGIPFFWGPTGGTSTFPKTFYEILSTQSMMLDSIRKFSACYQFNLSPRVVKANRKAEMIYTFSNADKERFRKRAQGQVKIMLDVGTFVSADYNLKVSADATKLRGIWCGRLDEYKALSILLNALAKDQITKENITFQIIGSGPLEAVLHKSAEGLNLKNLEWIKNISHEKVFDLISQADFFVHTSIKEATSSVIPEALSMGLPVICHDAFGMSIAINETCGIKIPFISPEHSINGFNEAIKRLIMDRDLLLELRHGARVRSTEISWDNMANIIANDYSNAAFPKANHQTISN